MNAPFYNHSGEIHPYLQILSAVLLVVIFVGPSWYIADMRSILKDLQRKNQLSVDGNWKELENFFVNSARTHRPFVWFHRKYLLPGNLESTHAMFLFTQGRLEEALAKNEEAIRRKESKPWIFRSFYSRACFNTLCATLRGRVLILDGMGRYDEGREVAAKIERLNGGKVKPYAELALLEHNCGHLDEALRLGQATGAESTELDTMRGIMSRCYTLKGDFQQAIQALSYAPADFTKFYSPADLKQLSEDPDGAELLEVKRRKLAGVYPPARFLKLARVYVAMEDYEKADQALDQAEKSLGPQPGLQVSYCGLRASSFAGQGKARETEIYIERLRAIAKERPRRPVFRQIHARIGRACLYLKRFNDAVWELNEAQKYILHPIEKHAVNYLLARAHEGAGNESEARRYYEMVAADPIPSWMRQQAAEWLAAR